MELSRWSSLTHQLVRKFNDGLGIDMNMKKFFIFVPVQTVKKKIIFVPVQQYKHHVRSIARSGVCPQRRSRLMPSRTHSRNLHVIYRWSALSWGSAAGLKVAARCSDAIPCISCEMQLCCCMADVRGDTAVVGALYVYSYRSPCPEI